MNTNEAKRYKYKPVRFFALAYLFTWIFWIPAIFLPENVGVALMAVGLLAPAVVSTLFVLLSKSDALKQDLKNKLVGFYKVKWGNVFLAVLVFAVIVVCSILLSLAFGQSLDQFAFTEDFSFTGVGVGSALITILAASIIEEVGCPLIATSVRPIDGDDEVENYTDPELIHDHFGSRVDLVVDGGIADTDPSTVVDCSDGIEVVRQGKGEIEK